MTLKRLSGRSGLTTCHSDILPLLMRIQSKSEEPVDFRGHDCSGVCASGDEKVKITSAAAVPHIGSLALASIGSLRHLFKRIVL
jgi:hypothetical protein